MARIITEPFALQSVAAGVTSISGVSLGGGGALAVSTSTGVRSGGAAIRSSNAGANGGAEFDITFAAAAGNGPYYGSVWLYPVSYPNATGSIFQLVDAAGTVGSKLRMQTDGSLILTDGANVQVGSASAILATNTLHHLEIVHFNNTGSGKAEQTAYLDDVLFASTTTGTNTGTISRVFAGCTSAVSAYDLYYADLIVNDNTAGGTETGRPGNQKILSLRPNAAGDSASWTRAGTDSGANFSQVNNTPPNDVTSYNQTSTLNAEDLYNFDSVANIVGASDLITVVEVGVRFNRSASVSPAFKVELEKTASGTKTQSAAITPSATAWKTNANAAPNISPVLTYLDPDGANWTQKTLETLQAGVIETTDTANNVQVSEVWVYVSYIPVRLLAITGVGN